MEEWTVRRKIEVAVKASAPGIYRMKAGGYMVRTKVTDPDGKKREVLRVLPDAKLQEAQRVKRDLTEAAKEKTKSLPSFASYALLVIRRKAEGGKLASVRTREKYVTETSHLVKAFGRLPVDKVDVAKIEAWKESLTVRIVRGELAATTANGWLQRLRQILDKARDEFGLPSNPAKVVEYFGFIQRTYTREKPNSLQPEVATRFLREMGRTYPQHFAYVVLGMVTGLRPSSLRALRRRGPESDVDWDRGMVLVRRSHGRNDDVMDATKVKKDQDIHLPHEVLLILQAHCEMLDDPPRNKRGKPPLWWRKEMAESDLLFPGRDGGYRARSAHKKPFEHVGEVIGLTYDITPRAMRRTFKDAARRAGVSEVASKAVSGHQTEAMHEHYQTIGADEMRAELVKVSRLLGAGSSDRVEKGVEGTSEDGKKR